MPQHEPLPLLPRALIEAGYEPPASYHRAHKAALDGLIPMRRSPSGRWSYNVADLPEIAKRLGLTQTVAADI